MDASEEAVSKVSLEIVDEATPIPEEAYGAYIEAELKRTADYFAPPRNREAQADRG